MQRKAKIERSTKETKITVTLTIDGSGKSEIDTGIGFLDHMLTLLASHGLFDLKVKAEGDLYVDGHHTVEDIGICLGQAIYQALGSKDSIKRYGTALVPMDEALGRAVLDLSGRTHLAFRVELSQEKVGELETSLINDFFQALAGEAKMTIHLDSEHGRSDHHVIEAVFKAFSRALAQAVEIDPRRKGVPSTKGVL